MESQPSTTQFTQAIRRQALSLGFDAVGICDATPPATEKFKQWLERGYAGQMDYLASRWDAYNDVNLVLDGARSIVMLTLPYHTQPAREPRAGEGRISRYAWGQTDYHDLIHSKLKQLRQWVLAERPHAQVRGVVDTAPVLERDLAIRAGLGWAGKNTLLLRRDGSWFFLAALLVDFELDHDSPFASDHCGTCTACLDACPTDAFPQPYVLDASRCISYLTIEHRDMVPVELREGIGSWLFGCDVCQDVCPWNHKQVPQGSTEFEPQEGNNPADAVEWFRLDEQQWRTRFRKTPLWRAKRRGLLRNAAIVLGNQPPGIATELLCRHLPDDDPIVRGSVAWALRRDHSPRARRALAEQLRREVDEAVIIELQRALAEGE